MEVHFTFQQASSFSYIAHFSAFDFDMSALMSSKKSYIKIELILLKKKLNFFKF